MNKSNVLKAITRRGWNPLDYKILEIFGNLIANEFTCSATLNTFHGSASTYMDLLVEKAKKDEGRKPRNEKLKAALKTKKQELHHIKTMGKVSSARVAANNHYVLDENVLGHLEEIEKCAEAAKAGVQTKAKRIGQ